MRVLIESSGPQKGPQASAPWKLDYASMVPVFGPEIEGAATRIGDRASTVPQRGTAASPAAHAIGVGTSGAGRRTAPRR